MLLAACLRCRDQRRLRNTMTVDEIEAEIAKGSDDFMRRVIKEEWPHEVVLAAIAPIEARWK